LVPQSIRLSLSLAGTAALALASIPFPISPAGAEEAKVAKSLLKNPAVSAKMGQPSI
jgi:hypothetical protein